MSVPEFSTTQWRAIEIVLLVLHENLSKNVKEASLANAKMRMNHFNATLKVIAKNYERFLKQIREYLEFGIYPIYMYNTRSFHGARKALANENITLASLS